MGNLRDYGLNYLIYSGFVDALVKKNMFPSDITDLYDDYRQETFMALCELKEDVWQKLYDTSLEKGTDYEYQIRNYVSMVVRNTVHSDSSAAYKRLKKNRKTEKIQTDVQWRCYANSIKEPKDITEQIKEYNE